MSKYLLSKCIVSPVLEKGVPLIACQAPARNFVHVGRHSAPDLLRQLSLKRQAGRAALRDLETFMLTIQTHTVAFEATYMCWLAT